MKVKRIPSEKEIIEIIEKRLPDIIKKNPLVRIKIEEILEKKAATKDDIKAILLQIEKNREETDKRFEEVLAGLAEQREEIKKIWKELEKQREETNKRFEEINKRFEQINKRFEQINQRFEEINKRFETLERTVFVGFKSMERTISAIGSRWGYGAEEAFRSGFEEVLSEIGYRVIKWRKIDDKGEFFLGRRPAEIDIVIKNKEKIAIEVKSSLTLSEVENFEKCVRFYEKEEKEKITKKIIVAIYPRKGTIEYAKKFNIKVIKGIKGLEKAEKYFKNL